MQRAEVSPSVVHERTFPVVSGLDTCRRGGHTHCTPPAQEMAGRQDWEHTQPEKQRGRMPVGPREDTQSKVGTEQKPQQKT